MRLGVEDGESLLKPFGWFSVIVLEILGSPHSKKPHSEGKMGPLERNRIVTACQARHGVVSLCGAVFFKDLEEL